MALLMGDRLHKPQAFISTYGPRIRTYGNPLLTPVIPQTQLPAARTTKRGTTAINYAEEFEDDIFEDSDGPRRPTGLRSLRREDLAQERTDQASQLGKEVNAPVEVQGIWRDWMGKPKRGLTEKQTQLQSHLPLTLIPIRIDLDIPSFRPEAPLPTPPNAREHGIDESNAAYKQPDPTPAYRLKDTFLWNLHEALMTPDQFAKVFVDEMDFPNERKQGLITQIATQIRTQLEEYAGVALHPLFSANPIATAAAPPYNPSASSVRPPLSRDQSATPAPGTGFQTPHVPSASGVSTPAHPSNGAIPLNGSVTAVATPLPAVNDDRDDLYNPDDTYRCIITLNINLLNKLYSDKFEWSLLHPPGVPEMFARITCADLGLAGEWVPALTHAIYEAVLRLKKEACENGGLVGSGSVLDGWGGIDNEAANGAEAGWRYDAEDLGAEWEPKVEMLSKEEIEKREGDRERQIRRLRRETARFSSTTGMQQQQDFLYQQQQQQLQQQHPGEEERMGRGERSKKKKRFRSLSPVERATPDLGYGGGGGGLTEVERQTWRCAHCRVWGTAVWGVRDGPHRPRSLCNNCGFLYERDKRLPPWSRDLFGTDWPADKYGRR